MKQFREILKGIIIGIANIIPGVSGGTMAVSMGIYDKLIGAINNIRKDFKNSVILLLPYLIGAILGIGILSFVVKYTLSTYPLQTSGLFIGLIVGGLPIIVNKVKGEKLRFSYIIMFGVFFGVVLLMAFSKEGSSAALDIKLNVMQMFILLLVGVVAAATMIIPGVSGSMVMMLLGYYNIIISNISNFIEAVFKMEINGIIHGIGVLTPFCIGILLGIGIIAKLITWLFEKAPTLTYWGILGLIIASPIAIIAKAGAITYTAAAVASSLACFAIGFAIAFFLGRE